MIYLRRVVGRSMEPTLRNGQVVVVSIFRNFLVGDIVVAQVNKREVIKRITDIRNGNVFLEGDNAELSTDSNNFGWIPDRHVTGKIIFPRKAQSKSRSRK